MAQSEVNTHPLPNIPLPPSQDQLDWLQRHDERMQEGATRHRLPEMSMSPSHDQDYEVQRQIQDDGMEDGYHRGVSEGSVQHTPSRSAVSVKRKAVPTLEQPHVRLEEAPWTLDSSPPRLNLVTQEDLVMSGERTNSPMIQTPTSAQQFDSPLRPPPSIPQQARLVDEESYSRSSSPSYALMEEEAESLDAEPAQETEGLQYHGFDDIPKKRAQNRVSHMTNQSNGSSSSGGDHRASQLVVPRAVSGLQRPLSQHALGSELRGRTLSPFGAHGSDHGSPTGYGRDLSSSRRSPASRPTSYIDLLSNLPYSQQVAPSGVLNHQSLQSAVGSAASLLNTKKTLEMYRANVKKTNDAAVQYEFAIYMINCSQDPELASDINSAELVTEAKHIFQKLADRAYPFAQYYLGDGYASGLFNKGKPDNDKAFTFFVAASKHSHAEAGYRTALCYEFGWGTAKSYPKAVQFYRAAAVKNHPGAATRLGMACLRNDMGLLGKERYREGLRWLKRAQESADFQYNAAPFELGLFHLTGFGDDIFKDEGYAAQLLTQSAELGHVQANFLMGQAYETGMYGCPKDAALSVHFYNGAATRGHAEAMMALCAWYVVGAEPVLEKDEREAFEWAKKAAEMGYAKAEYAMGYFTEMGIGCRRDPLEANVWYVQAADKGNKTAMHRLQIIRAAASGDPGIPAGGKGELNGKQKKKFMGLF